VEVVLAQVYKIMDPNYSAMSFDELMERQRFITKKYNAAYMGGASHEVMNQMLSHLEAIRQAMWEIGYKQSFEANKDSDPFKDSIA
jgi:Spy/CpxP family protein refolding chaperone